MPQEPTTEGQGGLVGALAGLVDYYTSLGPFDTCTLDLGWSHPNATVTEKSVVNTNSCGAGPATSTAG